MTAAIDIGNTFAKIGFFKAKKLLESHRGLTILALHDLILQKKPTNLIISSVTKSNEELKALFQDVQVSTLFLNQETPLPISKNYDTPQTLGMDRLAAAVGAYALFPKHDCLVIDMGTCIKYDLVKKEGTFEGGIISPGMQIRFKSFSTFTKRLPLVKAPLAKAEEKTPFVGKSTKECLQSGVINGIIAEANGIMASYKKIGVSRIILCGGDAPRFELALKKPTFAVPNLVLIGLNHILLYNIVNNSN